MAYYTGTNTDRKAYDDRFFEERGIFEDADDQVDSSDDKEDDEEYLDDEYVPGALVPDEEVYKEKKEDWRVGGEWL